MGIIDELFEGRSRQALRLGTSITAIDNLVYLNDGVCSVDIWEPDSHAPAPMGLIEAGQVLNPALVVAPSSGSCLGFTVESEVCTFSVLPIAELYQTIDRMPPERAAEVYRVLFGSFARTFIDMAEAFEVITTRRRDERLVWAINRFEDVGITPAVKQTTRARLSAHAGLSPASLSRALTANGLSLRKGRPINTSAYMVTL